MPEMPGQERHSEETTKCREKYSGYARPLFSIFLIDLILE